MNSVLVRVLGFGAAVAYLSIGSAWAQIYTESTTTAGGQTRTTRSYYMPGMFKSIQDDGGIVIMRFDRDYWIGADSKKKEYWQMTFADLEAKMKNLGGQMDAAMQQMRQKLESLPPEQRRQIEQMMGTQLTGKKAATGPLEVKKGGPSRKIAGLPCTRYAVTEGGREVLVLWSTREVPEFAALRKDYERFAKTMSAMRSRSGDDTQSRVWAEAMKAADGFPMETEAGGFKTTVTKLERKTTAASEFDAPAGYKKVPAPF